jgi:AmmeMemoRadiSam system protein B
MTPAEGAYRTPLGDVPLDREFIAELDQRIALTPVHDDAEHSLEIELPFLQVVLGSFSLVPIMFGEHIGDRGARDRLEALAAALAELSDASTLLVASTDLSHLDNYADVLATDRRVLELVAAFDLERLARALASGEAQACGGSGLFAALRAAQRRGACGAQVLAYTSSGDVTGNKKPGIYTVGYLAAAVYA